MPIFNIVWHSKTAHLAIEIQDWLPWQPHDIMQKYFVTVIHYPNTVQTPNVIEIGELSLSMIWALSPDILSRLLLIRWGDLGDVCY
jgi:hypothetical protein